MNDGFPYIASWAVCAHSKYVTKSDVLFAAPTHTTYSLSSHAGSHMSSHQLISDLTHTKGAAFSLGLSYHTMEFHTSELHQTTEVVTKQHHSTHHS